MDDLPAEILQPICWLSLNPELYLVSKKISSKLHPLCQFEMDVGLVLFCDRIGSKSAWGDVHPFPWQTPQAVVTDFKFSIDERRELQQSILDQSWFTPQKFRQLATGLCIIWIDRQWILADMSVETRKALQDYLESVLFKGAGTFYDNHGNMLWAHGYGDMSVFKKGDLSAPNKAVVKVLCYPLKLFVEPRSPLKLKFFRLLHLFRHYRQIDFPAPPVSYPHSAVRKALTSVVLDGDEDWFDVLSPLAVAGGVDIPVHQLVYEVSAAALDRRKWNIMKPICQGICLPDNYLESYIAPAVTQAISEGDSGAHGFQQWIEHDGWEEIQRGLTWPEW